VSGHGLAGNPVPDNWDVVPAGYLFRREKRTGAESEQLLSVYRDYGVIPKDSRDDNFNKASEDLSAYQLVEPSDLVINKMKAWQGSVGVSEHRGIVSPAYFVASPTRDFNRRYVHYLLRCSDYLVEYQTRSAGIRVGQWDLDWEDFRRIPVTLPPPELQESIANFLDEQTARIDALITEKERLLIALEELRLATVTQSLCEGLSKSQLLSTGDVWFPRVPAHWALCALNYRYEVELGKMLDDKRQTGLQQMPYLRNVDVRWDHIDTDALPVMDIAPEERERYTLQPGDLLVCEGGVGVGRAAIWSGRGGVVAYQKALHRVRPRSPRDMPRYLMYLMEDAVHRERVLGQEKATIPHLTAETFRRWKFPFPPYEQQRQVVEHLDTVSKRCRELAAHCHEHIDRLREYRSSLISATVTGHLDLSTFKEAA
jgi:type I restriction enzyme, S subunit